MLDEMAVSTKVKPASEIHVNQLSKFFFDHSLLKLWHNSLLKCRISFLSLGLHGKGDEIAGAFDCNRMVDLNMGVIMTQMDCKLAGPECSNKFLLARMKDFV